MRGPETLLPAVSANVLELEKRQQQAIRTVEILSRSAGKELPIYHMTDESVPEAPGVYLFDEAVASTGNILNADFDVDRRKISGAADSAHAVIAGNLTVGYANRTTSKVDIAAKCYQKRTFADRYERARREVFFMRKMAEEHYLTMEPVALVIAPPQQDSAIVLFTKFDETLYSLDNAAWQRGLTVMNTTDALAAASALGAFNARGYEHGDAKIKNVASRQGTGEIGMIDFETSSVFDIDDPAAAAAAAYSDLNTLLGSLRDKGFWKVRRSGYQNNAQVISDCLRHIAESAYLPNWESTSPKVQDAVYNAVVEAISIIDQDLSEFNYSVL